jgi:hypothetical protein
MAKHPQIVLPDMHHSSMRIRDAKPHTPPVNIDWHTDLERCARPCPIWHCAPHSSLFTLRDEHEFQTLLDFVGNPLRVGASVLLEPGTTSESLGGPIQQRSNKAS